MSIVSWLQGNSPKLGSKRKLSDSEDSDKKNGTPSKKKFTKQLTQADFDWYIQDTEGLLHCKLCRQAKIRQCHYI